MIYNIIIYLIQKMFSKIFLFVLLITCIYTYMLKSIKNNNDTNFQKLPADFNSELNGIQTIKPNLKVPDMSLVKLFVGLVFGEDYSRQTAKFLSNLEHYNQLYTKDLMLKFKECENAED